MAVMLERWNDERMDDLAANVDRILVQMHEQGREHRREILELRKDMQDGFRRVDEKFERVDKKFERVDEKFERVDERFARLERRITNAAIGLAGSIIVGFATLAAAL